MKFLKSPLSEFPIARPAPPDPFPSPLKANNRPALQSSDNRLCFRYRIIKRLMDIFLAAIITIFILSWLIPILACINWLDGNRPVFFVQKRVGWQNTFFQCYKLRTMRRGKGRNNISRWSYFLRCHKLDELPQFINVLKGEMSIVGPRPHMLSDHKAFSKAVGETYFERQAVLPGITGLAQVKGFEGRITSLAKLQGRVRYDMTYIREWSLGLDLKIMAITAYIIIKGLIKNLNEDAKERST